MSQQESGSEQNHQQFYSQPASNFQSDYGDSNKQDWYSQTKVEWNTWSNNDSSTNQQGKEDSFWSQETIKPSTSGYTLSQEENDMLIQALNKYENGN